MLLNSFLWFSHSMAAVSTLLQVYLFQIFDLLCLVTVVVDSLCVGY
jgi:hypothetical protein